MKLVSLNIEKRNHLDTVKAFLDREKADVVALMEVCEEDLDVLLGEYPHRVYGANFRMPDSGYKAGVVIASRSEVSEQVVFYADGDPSMEVPVQKKGNHRPVVVMVRVGGIRLAATHFTWTPDMSESDQQKADVGRLLDRLNGKEFVLCGDFNIPRGNDTYRLFAEKYRDNIPKDVVTTIDFDLHRAKREGIPKFEAVVDYIWTTSSYRVLNVRVVDGVSDHCGVVAQIAPQMNE
ncbi:hypothetical protein A3B57_02580 [Microgenomates group bacterium RIFCSPLOWO2_01_FULL_47_10]|nr:MAG: hypothetical protein A3B57_02580 [Microgenomates group bacterium RIFCSPLOWO2_01_FULL_47_10]